MFKAAKHRILFVCHGNICRSTMAQSVLQHLVDEAGCAEEFVIDSAATTTEELGMPPHRGTVRKLKQVGVPVVAHRARKVECAEYGDWDLVLYMDDENERHLLRIFGGDAEGKLVRLTAFVSGGELVDLDGAALPDSHDATCLACASATAPDVADPWYTGNFDETYRDVLAGCEGLLAWCLQSD